MAGPLGPCVVELEELVALLLVAPELWLTSEPKVSELELWVEDDDALLVVADSGDVSTPVESVDTGLLFVVVIEAFVSSLALGGLSEVGLFTVPPVPESE